MLLVTNGDSAAEGIARSDLPGEVLPWRDVLHEGPVPSGLSLSELREARARFIAQSGWGDLDEVMAEFASRDAALAAFRDHEEVVLLFEHDLYDQLQLIQLLGWFGQRDLGSTRLSMVCADEYLGTLGPDGMRELFRNRHEASAEELELGKRAWQASTSCDPTRVSALLGEGTSALPFLGAALLRHLQQFPSAKNSLSRSEAQALEEISLGKGVLREAFVASGQERENLMFLGDAVFARYLEGLSRCGDPLVLFEGGGRIVAPRGSADHSWFWDGEAALTESGHAVLEGEKDHVEINGIDRWLAGVRLSGNEARWRWDEPARELRRGAA